MKDFMNAHFDMLILGFLAILTLMFTFILELRGLQSTSMTTLATTVVAGAIGVARGKRQDVTATTAEEPMHVAIAPEVENDKY